MVVTARYDQRQSLPARNLGMVLDFATGSHARAAAILVLVALLNFLPGFFDTPPIDRDEARFAQATKQMIESGDYVDIRFQDEVRYKKPVGIYWLQAGAVKAAGALGLAQPLRTIWLYRVPSLLGAIAAVLLTYWTALAFVTRRAALIAALMMAGSLLLSIEARLATTDAMLLASVIAAMGVLARIYLPEQREHLDTISGWTLPAIFWTALAVGVHSRAVIVMVVALAAVVLSVIDRSARWLLALRPLIGLVWLRRWCCLGSRRHHQTGRRCLSGRVGRPRSHPEIVAARAMARRRHSIVLFWLTFFQGATRRHGGAGDLGGAP
jgi:4-amino-4-deoxy-L-arabinose transferase-like glycosyltransferase